MVDAANDDQPSRIGFSELVESADEIEKDKASVVSAAVTSSHAASSNAVPSRAVDDGVYVEGIRSVMGLEAPPIYAGSDVSAPPQSDVPPPSVSQTLDVNDVAPTFDHISFPRWPWELINELENTISRAAIESTGNCDADCARLLDRISKSLQQNMPSKVPLYKNAFNDVTYRRAECAHETDGSGWKRAMSQTMMNVMEQIDGARTMKVVLSNDALKKIKNLEKVANVHKERVASLRDPARRKQGTDIIRQRMAAAVQLIEQDYKANMVNAMRQGFARHNQPKFRGIDNNDSLLRVMKTLKDDETTLNVADAVKSFHSNALRAEIERWYIFTRNRSAQLYSTGGAGRA